MEKNNKKKNSKISKFVPKFMYWYPNEESPVDTIASAVRKQQF